MKQWNTSHILINSVKTAHFNITFPSKLRFSPSFSLEIFPVSISYTFLVALFGATAMFCEARLAQSAEHEILNLRVVASSPTSGDSF